MRAVLLVAAREFRQVIGTRGYRVMLLVVPLALAVSGFASSSSRPRAESVAFTLVDASGYYGERLAQRLERDYQRQVLRGLSTYVDRVKLASVDPRAPSGSAGQLAG